MSSSSLIVAGLVGFVQGFVAFATTVGLAPRLGALVVEIARKPYDSRASDARPRVSGWIARAICFMALVLLHIVVMEVVLGALSERNPAARAELGRIALFALVAGLAASRLLPEIEARIQDKKRDK